MTNLQLLIAFAVAVAMISAGLTWLMGAFGLILSGIVLLGVLIWAQSPEEAGNGE